MLRSLVGSEMCIRDSINAEYGTLPQKLPLPKSLPMTLSFVPTILARHSYARSSSSTGAIVWCNSTGSSDPPLAPIVFRTPLSTAGQPISPSSCKRRFPSPSPSPQPPKRQRKEHSPVVTSSCRMSFVELERSLTIGPTIGRGVVGTVKRARWRNKRTPSKRQSRMSKRDVMELAVKQVIAPGRGTGTGRREIEAIRKVGAHPNVVSVLYWAAGIAAGSPRAQEVWLVMPQHHQTVADLLLDRGRFPEDHARRLVRQLVRAVEQCHSRGVLHRDIKPPNLLCDEAGEELVLTDFSHAALVDRRELVAQPTARYMNQSALMSTSTSDPFWDGLDLTAGMVTPIYRAPELWDAMENEGRGTYGAAVDMWSVGCVWAEMLTATRLMNASSASALADQTRRFPGEVFSRFEFEECLISEQGMDLMQRMFSLDPQQRCTASQALEHPYMSF
eukprot:TRINITY_DN13624_c0_g1_i2.p1 TRINITY_DN13624_c0_g1~~TRINITY_DN13624_c0_g1_i2.p1  ORF type:complete len:446 (+),score=64.65 TRINITY_DN13624_c0_g1_i2:130-1467(+)